MPSEDRSFEPYFDWDAMPVELAEKMGDLLVEYRAAHDKLSEGDRSPQTIGSIIQMAEQLHDTEHDIKNAILRVPALVHVAGPVEEEYDEEHESEIVIQRCSRCRSTLAFWHEGFMAMTPMGPQRLGREDLPWFEPGAVVGKVEQGPSQTAYLIDDREPEDHEKECIDMEAAFSD
jgi:hypothetical protein